MNGRTWAVFIVIVVAVIGGMVYMARQDKLDVSDVGKDKAAGVLAAEDRNGNIEEHVLGKKDAKVVIVEYGDYQCPGCSTAAPKAKAVAEKYKDNVALIFRNFPIATIHPNARAAAAAAEAAGFQGKFWEMHDRSMPIKTPGHKPRPTIAPRSSSGMHVRSDSKKSSSKRDCLMRASPKRSILTLPSHARKASQERQPSTSTASWSSRQTTPTTSKMP